MLRLNLMASLSDPNTIKSLVSDFESEGLNFSDVPLDDMDVAKDMIVDRIMNSYTEVAAQGKAEYDASRAPANPGGGSSSSSQKGGKDYTERWADVDKAPGVPQRISGHTVVANPDDPNVYEVDGIMMDKETALDIVTN
jgi:hypothetical protein